MGGIVGGEGRYIVDGIQWGKPDVLGNAQRNDGLEIRDIPELDNEKMKFTKLPTRINAISELSKIRLPYFSFLGFGEYKYLLDYLKETMMDGEHLNPESAIILLDANMSRKDNANKFLSTILLARRIKSAIVRSGFR